MEAMEAMAVAAGPRGAGLRAGSGRGRPRGRRAAAARRAARAAAQPARAASPVRTGGKGSGTYARHLAAMVPRAALSEARPDAIALERAGEGAAGAADDGAASAALGAGGRAEPERERMVAAIDMGTNSFHMVIVRCLECGRFEVVDQLKEPVRLGGGTGGFSVVTPAGEQRALAAIQRFQRAADAKGAQLRAVATSAVREAHNRDVFVRQVSEATGVEVEVISGQEEARLIYKGVLQALPVHEQRALCIDIGGGSTELVLGHRGEALETASLRLGHVGLTELCVGEQLRSEEAGCSYTIVDDLVRETRTAVANALEEANLRSMVDEAGSFEVVVGSSGSAATIAVMINEMRQRQQESGGSGGGGNSKQGGGSGSGKDADRGAAPGSAPLTSGELTDLAFSRAELEELCDVVLGARTSSQRSKLAGISEKRVDVIIGGVLLMRELFRCLGIEHMRVSPYALREGVILDWMRSVLPAYTPSDDIRRTSVLHVARRFVPETRLGSSLRVARLARQLADGLLESCGLGQVVAAMSEARGGSEGGKAGARKKGAKGGKEKGGGSDTAAALQSEEFQELAAIRANDWELMEAAAVLHSVGLFVAHDGFHKHSWYLIKNNDHLQGYRALEVETIALLARYHRKKFPSPKHERLRLLPPAARRKFMVMASILRVAVALERCHTGAVANVHVLQEGTKVLLVVTPRREPGGSGADVSLELWAARHEIVLLERVLNCECTIVEGNPAPAGEDESSAAAGRPRRRGLFSS